MSSVYNWQRFWCSREGDVNLEHGYLQDPDGKYGEIYNPNAKRIEAFAQYPCLILLGEPGLGKSFEVAKHRALISAFGRTDVKSLIIDLSSYDNLERLDRKIFQSDEIKLWLADENSNLYLTLESFDECLIRIDALTSFLLEEFGKVPCKRLFLRIVCRTGYWTGPLESGLVKLYKEDNIRFIELMPLRRRDVEQAVKDENISIESFMKDIDAIAITPFAARPITLKFLVNQFKSTGELPESQEEAYRYGTLKLCDETNPLRIRTVTGGTLPAKKRLVIAERIAAIMIFSNNSRLFTLPDDGNILEGAISIDKIYGSEEIEGVNFFTDRNAILETLATGLFSSRGENQVGWSHQTYGEFLAASYLIHNNVDKKRIMNLISVLGCRINPQLYSVAAWLALMNREIFEIIRKSEPEILLLGDITTTTEEQKENLCRDYLLKIAETNVIERRLWENLRYDRLKYEKLAEQLEIYISDKEANDNVRREAMFIAEACRVQNLSPILLNIALDVEETLNIRSMAAFVIARVGGSADRAKLKPLIYDDSQDSVDQIRGYALEAVWPEYLSAEEDRVQLSSQK